MARLRKTGLITLAALLGATQASAQMKVAQPQDIVEAVASCMAATSAGSIDAAQLAADGWTPATMSAEGRPVDSPLRIFGRKQSAAIIMTSTSADVVCIATARIATPARFADVERALSTRLGGQIVERKSGETMFFTGGKVVSIMLTGKPRTPAVRIGVMQMPQEKK